MMKLCDHFIDTADILQMENKHGQASYFQMIFRVKREYCTHKYAYLKEKNIYILFSHAKFWQLNWGELTSAVYLFGI